MSKYAVGQRLVMHIEGTVSELTPHFAWVTPDDGSQRWSVEYDDPDWKPIEPERGKLIFHDVLTEEQKAAARRAFDSLTRGYMPKRSERELELEGLCIEMLDDLALVVDALPVGSPIASLAARLVAHYAADLEKLQQA